MFPLLTACFASFLLLSRVPEGGGGGTPDLWMRGAPGYLLSCHISLLSKLREPGRPRGASVLNDSGHLGLTRSPYVPLGSEWFTGRRDGIREAGGRAHSPAWTGKEEWAPLNNTPISSSRRFVWVWPPLTAAVTPGRVNLTGEREGGGRGPPLA